MNTILGHTDFSTQYRTNQTREHRMCARSKSFRLLTSGTNGKVDRFVNVSTGKVTSDAMCQVSSENMGLYLFVHVYLYTCVHVCACMCVRAK